MSERVRVLLGDCRERLAELDAESVHAVVTDPPAGISFMGNAWDSDKGGRDAWIAWMAGVAAECLRVIKPGGHALVWALPRTSHWTATAWENAGWEPRDRLAHLFATGFPKSLDVSKALDRMAGAEREALGERKGTGSRAMCGRREGKGFGPVVSITAPVTDAARKWAGWGTAIKPAVEDWWLFRKPLSEPSVAANVLKHGTGALNIDACRIKRDPADVPGWHQTGADGTQGFQGTGTFRTREMSAEEIADRCSGGRWPANVIFSHHSEHCAETCAPGCPVAELDRQSGVSRASSGAITRKTTLHDTDDGWGMRHATHAGDGYGDTGTASRFFHVTEPEVPFFYVPKPAKSERNKGCESLPNRTRNRVNPGGLENDPRWAPVEAKNHHPTLKPVTLLRYLCRLICPPDGVVLDPFMGSGSTGMAAMDEGFGFIGIELQPDYFAVAEARLLASVNLFSGVPEAEL